MKIYLNIKIKNIIITTTTVILLLILTFGYGYFTGRYEQIKLNKSSLIKVPNINCDSTKH